MSASSDDIALTVKEAAKFLNISEMTVLRLSSQGIIPGWKLGRQWRFSKSALIEHLKNQNKQGSAHV